MKDSGRIKGKITTAREKLLNFYKNDQKKVILDIEGLSHDEVSEIIFGNPFSSLLIMIRYCLSTIMYPMPFSSLKVFFYRLFGAKIGVNVYIGPAVYLDIIKPRLITIGNNVMLGMGTSMVIHERTMKTLTVGRIEIKDNVTIGGITLIRPGVTISDNAEVDAMLNVTKNVMKGEKLVNYRNYRNIDEESII